MATIRKRGSTWNVQIRKAGHQTISKTFKLKQDAVKWSRKTESELERGLYQDTTEAQQTTLQEVVKRYEREVLPSKKSREVIAYRLKTIGSALGDHSLAQLTPSIIAKYRDCRIEAVSSASVRAELSIIRRVLDTAIKEWGIYLPFGNPLLQVRYPNNPKGRERRLEAGEESKLLGELQGNQTVSAIVQLAVETAMRRGEIANLEWEHVNLQARTLHIPETKTDTPRTIPLSTKAVEVLYSLPRNISGKVFTIQSGSITQAFKRACKRADIEGLNFHDLRHEATTRLFEKGLNVMEVSSITGHKDLKMLRRYTHLKPESLLEKLG